MKFAPSYVASAVMTLVVAASAISPAVAAPSSATPKPKISVAPKTLRDAKYKQDTMIKRSERHQEATGGNTASSENPQKPYPKPTASP